MIYIPSDHFWQVNGEDKFYSSKADAFVSAVPEDFTGSVTKISSRSELAKVLYVAGVSSTTLPFTPNFVTMAQARIALQNAGKLKAIQKGLESLPEPERTVALTAWEYAPTVSRSGELVQTLSKSFGLSDDDLDELFITAANIKL